MRSRASSAAPNVFPGGSVDFEDSELESLCVELDDAAASERLRVADGGLAY